MPAGFFWVLLVGLLVYGGWRRQWWLTGAVGVILLGYTLAGIEWVSAGLATSLEAQYLEIAPFEVEPFDAVIVLGGGLRYVPPTGPQVENGGDRVVLGAELYHAGQTDAFVATGRRWDAAEDKPTHAEVTKQMWEKLGIPEHAIYTSGGRNTSEEMRELAALIEEQEWQRVGLVTSAWHLQRAERLASSNGLEIEPLPADFQGVYPDFRLSRLVPNGAALQRTHRMLKERLAGLVGS